MHVCPPYHLQMQALQASKWKLVTFHRVYLMMVSVRWCVLWVLCSSWSTELHRLVWRSLGFQLSAASAAALADTMTSTSSAAAISASIEKGSSNLWSSPKSGPKGGSKRVLWEDQILKPRHNKRGRKGMTILKKAKSNRERAPTWQNLHTNIKNVFWQDSTQRQSEEFWELRRTKPSLQTAGGGFKLCRVPLSKSNLCITLLECLLQNCLNLVVRAAKFFHLIILQAPCHEQTLVLHMLCRIILLACT